MRSFARAVIGFGIAGAAACGSVGAAGSDAGVDSAPSPRTWSFQTRTITGLRLIDPSLAYGGKHVRVAITWQLGACELPARPLVAENDGTDPQTVTITAHAFQPQGGAACAEGPRSLEQSVDLGLSGGDWTISAGTAQALSLNVGPGPHHLCTSAALGAECVEDCDCTDAGGTCIGYGADLASSMLVCAVACIDDRSCDTGLANSSGHACVAAPDGAPAYTCDQATPECSADRPCPTGWSCDAGTCAAGFQLGDGTRHSCSDDADCDAGLLCVQTTAGGSTCELPCDSDAWCPDLHTCGNLGSIGIPPTANDSICQFVGE